MLIVIPQSRRPPSRRTHGRPRLLGAVALAVALLAAGCGTHLVKVRSTVLRLRIDEYSITPQDVQVRAGRLKLIVVNTGILTHNVRVESTAPNRDGNPNVVGGTGVLQPGQQTGIAQVGQALVESPKLDLQPGTYKLVDTIANHADLGDYGTLTVVR